MFYIRSARYRLRIRRLIETDAGHHPEALALAEASLRKEVHGAVVYGLLVLSALLVGRVDVSNITVVLGLLGVPAVMSVWWARTAVEESRMARNRYALERPGRARLWSRSISPRRRGRPAWRPRRCPTSADSRLAGSTSRGRGSWRGDFFDVHRVGRHRVAAVIGDVAGHGIESSITAFQAKYLLRVFLRQFRDPAQAFEEINAQLASGDRNEEFISACVVVFDTEAGTLRYSSAGHPAAFLFKADGVAPLRSTGPLLMLDPKATYFSREIPMVSGDLVVMYTDGLAEARSGRQMFGESRIIRSVERDLNAAPDVLCKSLLDAAKDFAGGSIGDDTAIMAIRRD